MGPHFFKCGKGWKCTSRALTKIRFNGAALFQVRKGQSSKRASWQSSKRFNGAALFQVRKATALKQIAVEQEELQWGRTFSSAERPDESIKAKNVWSASMGPHFFKCGKCAARRIQRSRLGRFNGAALFQVRKGGSLPAFPLPMALLQWGRTFSSAESRRLYG